MDREFRLANVDDIDEILQLHLRYQIDSIDERDKQDGFITTAFNQQQLVELIAEAGLSIAILNGHIVAYAMAASWQFWSRWPMFAYMMEGLSTLEYKGQQISVENSYQYGPVCVDKHVRGCGVFEGIFAFSLSQMASRYPILVTFINKTNSRSFIAHTQKAKLDVIQEFTYNNNQYYELACLTSLKFDKGSI
ncbi:GNAT family acetyltransferase [Flocculibacter collagenilyticus]|uniref:GNAT family acetyltransferase n=1 Tax=Flocculibacter collagenilyticus TaxID=2744479 RepID=UPI0018F54D38|nr:GNAT family acetyltransferase [Flocculibacter collagenilyticus]